MTLPTSRGKRRELDSLAALRAHLAQSADLGDFVLQALDLSSVPELDTANVQGAVLLGCEFRDATQANELVERGAAVFPALRNLPYDPYRSSLYTVEEL